MGEEEEGRLKGEEENMTQNFTLEQRNLHRKTQEDLHITQHLFKAKNKTPLYVAEKLRTSPLGNFTNASKSAELPFRLFPFFFFFLFTVNEQRKGIDLQAKSLFKNATKNCSCIKGIKL